MNFKYNHEKNAELLKTRGIGFEEIIQSISDVNLLDIRKHHNQDKYRLCPFDCVNSHRL